MGRRTSAVPVDTHSKNVSSTRHGRGESAARLVDRHGYPVVGWRKSLRSELTHHLPFTTLSVLATTLAIGVISQRQAIRWEVGHFEGFHYTHLFASAVATTAVFWRHRRDPFLAVGVGVCGSVLFCTMSDIVLPYLGGNLFGIPIEWELEAVRSPFSVFGASLFGSLFGFIHLRYLSIYSHSVHVAISSLASLTYLLTHTSARWFSWAHAPGVVVILLVAVFLPCCLSDLVMPVACTHCGIRRSVSRRKD